MSTQYENRRRTERADSRLRRSSEKRPAPAPEASAETEAKALHRLLILLCSVTPAPDEAAASALSELCGLAKKKAIREKIAADVPDGTLFSRYLNAAGFKTRKNAARLLGALTREETFVPLTEALERETVLMTVPSLLLAVGSFSTPDAETVLNAYPLPEPKDPTEEKNVAEIASAKKTALAGFLSAQRFAPLERFPVPTRVLLTAPEGFAPTLFNELSLLGLVPELTEDGCLLTAEKTAPLFRARCFSELLIPVDAPASDGPEALAAAFAPAPGLPYRVELRGYTGDRTAFIRRFTAALGGTDNPSHYALELRIEFTGKGVRLFRRPANLSDPRHAYRVKTVAASIRPETAACLIRFARANASSLCEKPHVLDPFAGSGTFLFEREALGPCASLTGVDIKSETVRLAMGNAHAVRSSARFIEKDCLRFIPREPVDELYANLPFGNRVGTHENNEKLYRGFIARLPAMLSATGFALLYTMEWRLLEKCLRAEPALRVRARVETEAGGLLPHAFLIERDR